MIKDGSRHRRRLMLFAAVVVAMLCAGLNPRDYGFRNNVKWTKHGVGIEFGAYGTAYTEPFVTGEVAKQFANDGFSLELALSCLENTQQRFAISIQFFSAFAFKSKSEEVK